MCGDEQTESWTLILQRFVVDVIAATIVTIMGLVVAVDPLSSRSDFERNSACRRNPRLTAKVLTFLSAHAFTIILLVYYVRACNTAIQRTEWRSLFFFVLVAVRALKQEVLSAASCLCAEVVKLPPPNLP